MPSLRAAINAKCKSCIHDPGSGGGTWREQVTACSSSNCPLHSVRPQSGAKQSRGAPIDRSAAAGALKSVAAKTGAEIARTGGVT